MTDDTIDLNCNDANLTISSDYIATHTPCMTDVSATTRAIFDDWQSYDVTVDKPYVVPDPQFVEEFPSLAAVRDMMAHNPGLRSTFEKFRSMYILSNSEHIEESST